ncbi:MAG: response regulator transcription factor [Adlercreutzia equolifaciens]
MRRSRPLLCLYVCWERVVLCFFGLAKGSSDVLVFPRRETEAAAIIGRRSSQTVRSIKERFSLTNRERDVLLLMARGQSRREIAENLILSENTVRGYSKTSIRKLACTAVRSCRACLC